MANIEVHSTLIEAVKAKLAKDPNRNKSVASPRSPLSRLYDIINKFIDQSLKDYDENLAADYKAKEKKDGTFFNQRTLRRAIDDRVASKELVDVLGYYAYGEAWTEERKKLLTATLIQSSDEEAKDNAVAQTSYRKFLLPLLLLVSVGLVISTIIFYPNNDDDKPPSPPPSPKCDCLIGLMPVEYQEIDSTQYQKINDIIDWNNNINLQTQIRQSAEQYVEQMDTELFAQETQTIIKRLTSSYPQFDSLIIKIQVFRTYYCAVDKLFCGGKHLSDDERMNLRHQNLSSYNGKIELLMTDKKTEQRKDTPAKIEIKQALPKPKTFSLSGIAKNSPLFKSVETATTIKNSFKKERTFDIVIQSNYKPVAKDADQLYYYVSPGQLEIIINGSECCCTPNSKFKITGTSKRADNSINAVKTELRSQINQLVEQHHQELAQIIKSCIDL